MPGAGGEAGVIDLHIDTDMGVDDALALACAARLAGVRIAAVSTVFGNVPLVTATRNALALRELMQASFPVFRGAAKASDGFRRHARHVHGADGLGGATTRLGAGWLARVAAMPTLPLDRIPRPERPVVLLALGPATNLPALIDRYGRDRIARIVVMGGAVFDVGNVTPEAEFNTWCDPGALAAVLARRIPLTLVPLDVCRKVVLPHAALRAYAASHRSRLARLLVAAHAHYIGAYREREGIDGCFPHDTVALLAACRPSWFHLVAGRLRIDTTPAHRGRTRLVPDHRGPVDVALGGDLAAVRRFVAALDT